MTYEEALEEIGVLAEGLAHLAVHKEPDARRIIAVYAKETAEKIVALAEAALGEGKEERR